MDLQVCSCGWSKVTTYHGLRVHQGRMGCTPKGVRVEEHEQQYVWGDVGCASNQLDFRLDAYIAVDFTQYYSNKSFQVCHYCGWSKVTTYQGLRIHQGKMGCTPKGVRIPEKEQHGWKVEEVAEKKHQPTKRQTVKKENTPQPPSTRVRSSSAAATAMIKEEHESPFSAPQHSSQRATKPKSHHQLHHLPTGAQVETSAREPPTAAHPVRVVRPKEKDSRPTLPRKADSRAVAGCWSNDPAPTAVRVKEEAKSPLAIQQRSSSRAKNSVCRPNDWTSSSQAKQENMLVREPPPVPPKVTPPQSQERDRKTLPQAKPLVRERPTSSCPAAAVRPEERLREDQTSPQNVPESPNINSATAATVKEPKSPPRPSSQRDTNPKTNELQDVCADMPAKNYRTSRECPTTPPHSTTVSQPEEQNRKDQTPSQAMDERFKSELQQKIQLREEKMSEIRALERVSEERASESVPDTSTNTQSKCAAAEATTEEDPTTSTESESSSPDFSTGMKVKELARMFSSTTSQETAVRPQGKHREEQKQSQVKLTDQKLPANTEQETAVQPNEEEKEVQSVSQNVSDPTCATTQTNPPSAEATAEEDDPKPSCEAAQLSDFSTGMKVKELARMFSATTNQETAVLPKVKQREGRKLPQNVSDPTSATTQTNPPSAEATAEEDDPKPSCEAAQLSDFSTGMKVKELARMFSATTNQETAVLPKVKQREGRKLSQVKLIAQRLSVAAQETAASNQKKKDKTDQSDHSASGSKAGPNQ